MELKHTHFAKYLNRWFVETGSYMGDGVQAALDSGFKFVMSLDIDSYNYNQCLERFKGNENVWILNDDSAMVLFDDIISIKEPITFWLDAHYSGESTPFGIVRHPVLYELEQICQHPIKEHTILIDDVRTFKHPSPERDFTLWHIIASLKAINPNYIIEYVDGSEPQDVLIAHL